MSDQAVEQLQQVEASMTDADLGSQSGFKQQATDSNQQSRLSVTPVLTSHELYEIKQQQQQQQQFEQTSQFTLPVAVAPKATSITRQVSPSGSFRNSKYRGLERQESVIVGTPGFREKYGK